MTDSRFSASVAPSDVLQPSPIRTIAGVLSWNLLDADPERVRACATFLVRAVLVISLVESLAWAYARFTGAAPPFSGTLVGATVVGTVIALLSFALVGALRVPLVHAEPSPLTGSSGPTARADRADLAGPFFLAAMALRVFSDVALTPNHVWLQLWMALLMTCCGTRSHEGRALLVGCARWLGLLVVIWAGVQKLRFGAYLNAAYGTYLIAYATKVSVWAGLLVSDAELARIQALALADAPHFETRAPGLIVAMNAIWIVEIVGPLLVLWSRTRRAGVALLVILFVGAMVVAREWVFASHMLLIVWLFRRMGASRQAAASDARHAAFSGGASVRSAFVCSVVLASVALWPLGHAWMVARYDANPWRLGGWAMYATAPPEVVGEAAWRCPPGSPSFADPLPADPPVEVDARDASGVRDETGVPRTTTLSPDLERRVVRMRELGRLVDPRLAMTSQMRDDPLRAHCALELRVRRRVLDPRSARWVERELGVWIVAAEPRDPRE